MQNKAQICKHLISSKTITDPIKIYTYEHEHNSRKDYKTQESESVGKTLISILEEIQNNYNEKCPTILVLGRFWTDGENLKLSGFFEYKKEKKDDKETCYLIPKNENLYNLSIIYSTVHSAKGLGFENVILINCKDGIMGFPSKNSTDPLFRILSDHSNEIDFAEERRLFYVAMTRTKKRFYIVAPYDEPSSFLLELVDNNKNIPIIGVP